MDLTARRKRKKDEEKDDDKAKLIDVFQAISDAIDREKLSKLPPFPRHYFSCDPDGSGNRAVLVETDEPGVVRLVSDEALVNDVLTYTRYELADFRAFQLTHRQAVDAAKYWRGISKAVPMPAPFRWPDEPGLTFRRLPWSAYVDPTGEHTKTWNKLVSRMSNGQAFIEWIGSLFFPDSDLQQYVWMRGLGNDGKGSINRFLERVFAASYCSKQPPDRDKFWTYSLMGKRLVVFPDCNNYTFVSTGLFKSLTGGDPIDIEAKGRMGFTIKPNCKFLFLSQEKPSLSSERADQRRIIYCEFADSATWEPGFEERLWAEGGHFLGTCIDAYERAHPDHGPITADMGEITEWVETLEGEYSDIFSEYFRVSFETEDREGWVRARGFQRKLLRIFKHDRKQVRGFMSWLERQHRIKGVPCRFVTGVDRAYKGLLLTKEAPIFE